MSRGYRDDRRSDQARVWRRLYNTTRWRRLRAWQLNGEPLCERCTMLGRVTAASVANHRIEHKGDEALFFDPENLESLCSPCHDGEVQSREKTGRGYDSAVGADGLPVDRENHPFFKKR